jgi:hypothetical protein
MNQAQIEQRAATLTAFKIIEEYAMHLSEGGRTPSFVSSYKSFRKKKKKRCRIVRSDLFVELQSGHEPDENDSLPVIDWGDDIPFESHIMTKLFFEFVTKMKAIDPEFSMTEEKWDKFGELVSSLKQYCIDHNLEPQSGIETQSWPFNFSVGADDRTLDMIDSKLTSFVETLAHGTKIDVGDKTVELIVDAIMLSTLAFAMATDNYSLKAIVAIVVALRFKRYKDFVSSLFQKSKGLEVQSGSDNALGLVGALFLYKMIDSMHYCTSLSDVLDWTNENMKRSFGSNSSKAFESFLSFVQLCLDKLSNFVSGKDSDWRIISNSSTAVRSKLDEIRDVLTAWSVNKLTAEEFVLQSTILMDEITRFSKDLDKGGNLFCVVKTITNKLNTEILTARSIIGSDSGDRVEPVCVMLVGEPKIGKTTFNSILSQQFVVTLSNDFMREVFSKDPRQIGKNIFCLDQTDAYYSGYKNQPVVLIDEMDPNPPASGMISTPHKLIRLINTGACPLNMADLGSKGTTYFTSKVIMGTTNCHNWNNLVGISDPNAFFRRVYFVKMTLRKGVDKEENVRFMKRVSDEFFKLNTVEGSPTSFMEYIDYCYSGVDFVLHELTSNQPTILPYGGEVKPPSEIIRFLNDSAKSKSEDHAFKGFMASSILREYERGFDAVTNEPGSFSKLDLRRATTTPLPQKSELPGSFSAADRVRASFTPLPGSVEAQGLSMSIPFIANRYYHKTKAVAPDYFVTCLASNKSNCHDFAVEQISTHHDFPRVRLNGWKYYVDINPIDESHIGDVKELTEMIDVLSKVPYIDDLEGGNEYSEFFVKYRVYYSCAKIYLRKKSGASAKLALVKLFDWKKAALDFGLLTVSVLGIKFVVESILNSGDFFHKESDYPLHQRKKTTGQKVRTIDMPSVEAQSGVDQRVRSFVKNNVYRFEIFGAGAKTMYSHFTCVQERLALIPSHTLFQLYEYFDECPHAKMRVYRSGNRDKFQEFSRDCLLTDESGEWEWRGGVIPVGDTFVNPDTNESEHIDLVLININVVARDSVNFFMNDDIFSKNVAYHDQAVLGSIMDDGIMHMPQGKVRTNMDWRTVRTLCSDKETYHYFGRNIVNYDIDTERGHCGAPVFMRIKSTWRLAGIHVAGIRVGSCGYALSVSASDIEKAINMHFKHNSKQPGPNLVLRSPDAKALESQGLSSSVEVDSKDIDHVLVATAKRKSTSNSRSRIIKSPVHSMIKCEQEMVPAHLSKFTIDGVTIDPMLIAQKGYGEVRMAPMPSLINCIVHNMWQKLSSQERLTFEKHSDYTWEQVASPGPGWTGIKSIPRSTSAGYPLCVSLPNKKWDIFGSDDDYAFHSDAWRDLVAQCENAERDIVAGKSPLFVVMSFLKDECRPVEKANIGKTRLISCAPLLHTMLLRKYTMGFVNWSSRNRIRNGTAVGVNPYSDEWQQIYNEHGYSNFNPVDKRTAAGDFSGFDKNLHYLWIDAFASLLDLFYDDLGTDTCTIRRVLLHSVSFSTHIVGSEIFKWVGSNTSGNALTVQINSYCNLMMTQYVITLQYMEVNLSTINVDHFEVSLQTLFSPGEEHFAITVYGDDGLITLLARYMEHTTWFCPKTLAMAYFKFLGVVFTDEIKGVDFGPLRPLSECTFLKRGFSKTCLLEDKGRVMAPLLLDTILNSIRWMKDKDGSLEAWSNNVNHMLEELSAHDTSTYILNAGTIVNACNKVTGRRPNGLPSVVPRQRGLQLKLCSRDYVY